MLYKLIITSGTKRQLIDDIQKKHKNDIPGITELYDELHVLNYCESYKKERIFYVGYTLAKNGIFFEYMIKDDRW